MARTTQPKIRLLIPTGRMNQELLRLMDESGFGIEGGGRNYRPLCRDSELEIKFIKPINIPRLVALGRHDLGFCGFDWVKEHKAPVNVVMDLGLDPVRLVLAAPKGQTLSKLKRRRNLVLATEYESLSKRYLKEKKISATVLRTNGTTEVYPPDDADLIVDNTATGSTLKANNLHILDTLMTSSTCLVGNRDALKRSEVVAKADHIVTLLAATLEARTKVMLEMNVTDKKLRSLLIVLPAMKQPTVQPLAGGTDFAVKTVVDRSLVRDLIPVLRAKGASDIVEMPLRKVLP